MYVLDWVKEYREYVIKYSRYFGMYGVGESQYKYEDYEEGDMFFTCADKADFFVSTLEECICKNANTPNAMRYNIDVLFSLFDDLDNYFACYDEDYINYDINPLFDVEKCKSKLWSLRANLNITIKGVTERLFKLCSACKYNMPVDFMRSANTFRLTDVCTNKGGEEGCIKDYLIVKDKETLLKKMHEYLDVQGRKGKAAALLVSACMELGLTERIPYNAMKKEFSDIGNRPGYNNQLNKQFSDKEKQPIKEFLKD